MHKPSLGERLSVLTKTKFGMAIFWPFRKKEKKKKQSPSCMQGSSNVNSPPLGMMQGGKAAVGFPALKAAHQKLWKQGFVNWKTEDLYHIISSSV